MRTWRLRVACLAAGLSLLPLGGCAPRMQPAEFFQLTEQGAAQRAMQSRVVEAPDQKELLSAAAAVLQDLGFQVEEVVKDVGLVRAVKERSAREYGQEIGRFFVTIISFGYVRLPIDLQQKISAVLVARPVNADATRHEVRITFYRVVWKGEGWVERQGIPPGDQATEMIRDAEIYQAFFAGLSKAVFLERFTL